MFLRIENPVKVIPSIELLRTLGASSARGLTEKIGQFGSGFPYALALLAREGLLFTLKLCLGKDVYTFSTKASSAKTSRGDDFDIHEIIMKKQNGGSVNLNISTEFGAIDWQDVTMVLREFISNAIDGTTEYGWHPSKTILERVEDNQCRSKDGTVRVYIQLTEEIDEYIRDINKHFICLTPFYEEAKRVIPNRESGSTRFYRKGVRVGSFGNKSLFHYNIPDLALKESRTLDSYAARESAASAIRDSDIPTIKRFLQSFAEGEYWEHSLPSADFDPYYAQGNADSVRSNWGSAYKAVFGNAILCSGSVTAEMARAKGYQVITPSETLRSILNNLADGKTIKRETDILTKDESEGKSISEATSDVIATLDKIWDLIERHHLTNGKSKPLIKCFSEVMKAEGNRFGYYRDNTVFINTDYASACFALTQTMLEEVSHHVTGARDCTRDFQDFAFRVAALMVH